MEVRKRIGKMNMNYYGRILKLIFFLLFPLTSFSHILKNHYGYLEKIYLLPYKIAITAKLDTGATNSSLYATKLHYYFRNNEEWVHFTVPMKSTQQSLIFDKKIMGQSIIKLKQRSFSDNHKRTIKRPIVQMKICLGHEEKIIRINLANRKHFLYKILVGRETLMQFKAIVDPSKKFMRRVGC